MLLDDPVPLTTILVIAQALAPVSLNFLNMHGFQSVKSRKVSSRRNWMCMFYILFVLFKAKINTPHFKVSILLGISRTPKEGAATTLYAAVHPDLNKEEFVYYSDCKAASCSGASR